MKGYVQEGTGVIRLGRLRPGRSRPEARVYFRRIHTLPALLHTQQRVARIHGVGPPAPAGGGPLPGGNLLHEGPLALPLLRKPLRPLGRVPACNGGAEGSSQLMGFE